MTPSRPDLSLTRLTNRVRTYIEQLERENEALRSRLSEIPDTDGPITLFSVHTVTEPSSHPRRLKRDARFRFAVPSPDPRLANDREFIEVSYSRDHRGPSDPPSDTIQVYASRPLTLLPQSSNIVVVGLQP